MRNGFACTSVRAAILNYLNIMIQTLAILNDERQLLVNFFLSFFRFDDIWFQTSLQ